LAGFCVELSKPPLQMIQVPAGNFFG
jgi:hypothetical protein